MVTISSSGRMLLAPWLLVTAVLRKLKLRTRILCLFVMQPLLTAIILSSVWTLLVATVSLSVVPSNLRAPGSLALTLLAVTTVSGCLFFYSHAPTLCGFQSFFHACTHGGFRLFRLWYFIHGGLLKDVFLLEPAHGLFCHDACSLKPTSMVHRISQGGNISVTLACSGGCTTTLYSSSSSFPYLMLLAVTV